MRSSDTCDGELFTIAYEPEDAEPQAIREGVSMASRAADFVMPSTWQADETHPDLLALGSLLSVRPFISRRLHLARGVSQPFADVARSRSGVEVGPIDQDLQPRQVGRGVPGLAFSGGVGSVAALLAMPDDTVSLFTDRLPPTGGAASVSLYRPDAARAACRALRDRGLRVIQVPTDLEHLRSPIGFATDLADAVPLVLLADLLHLDAVAWGTVAESAYRIGHRRFQPYHERAAYREWAELFAVVGLPIVNPVAGVSEVGTSMIVRESGWSAVARSCIRGTVSRPCQNCWKCFRRTLLDAAISGRWPSDPEISELFAIKEATHQRSRIPIKHENVMAYLCSRYPGDHPAMLRLARRVRAEELDLSYLDRWYAPSSLTWDEKYGPEIARRLDNSLGRMTTEQEGRFESWDMSPLTAPGPARSRAEAYGALCAAETDLRSRGRGGMQAAVEAPTVEGYRGRDAPNQRLDGEIEAVEAELAATRRSWSFRVGSLLEGRGGATDEG